jgi:sulfur carrier protein ThiS
VTGAQEPVEAGPDILAWTREDLLVAVNFSDRTVPLDVEGELVLSSAARREALSASLEPSEALIVRVTT